MNQSPVSRKREIIAALSVLIVIVVIVGAIAITNKKDASNKTDTSIASNSPDSTSSDDSEATSAEYRNGKYTATGTYDSPGGPEEITVSVTLKNGVVIDTSAIGDPSGATAEEYQGKFISGYKKQVVGKTIDSISLDRVSGSSLTSQGFNRAIEQILKEAQG